MIVLDITDTDFIQLLDAEQANDWMHEHVGNLMYDSGDSTLGIGWEIFLEDQTDRWLAKFDDDSKATLFSLRWL